MSIHFWVPGTSNCLRDSLFTTIDQKCMEPLNLLRIQTVPADELVLRLVDSRHEISSVSVHGDWCQCYDMYFWIIRIGFSWYFSSFVDSICSEICAKNRIRWIEQEMSLRISMIMWFMAKIRRLTLKTLSNFGSSTSTLCAFDQATVFTWKMKCDYVRHFLSQNLD